ncbi:zinc-ribbon domain-containing protein [Thiomonas sp. FB-Cd]|uniref:zinc-ribbon domain-containing protein n=1 Tax=Thiomonas sp. FB-Cd TaxID=1158292 RepID=UPI0004DFCDFC
MSLATRCPHCNTAFRLVRDQLLLSQGWVRCGRCGEAFNAAEQQFTFDPAPGGVDPTSRVSAVPAESSTLLGHVPDDANDNSKPPHRPLIRRPPLA